MTTSISDVKYDDVDTVPSIYKPVIYKIKTSDKKDYAVSPEMSLNIDYPLLSLGFQQYLHANVTKMEILKEFEGKKKIYTTMHLFESNIDDYDADIETVTTEYFKLTDKQKILGTGFYKLWEILAMFDIIPLNTESFISAHIFESDGSLAQATALFRETFAKKSHQKDKHYILTSTSTTVIDSEFTKSLGKKITIKQLPADDTIVNPKIIKSFVETTGKKVDFVTAYAASDWKYKVTHEQEIIESVIGEITCALGMLNTNGCFVCRVYETFTTTMCKIVYMLSLFFNEVFIVKPLMSHASTSEKFIVCKGYKQKPKLLEQFEKLAKICSDNQKLNVVNIFPDLIFPDDFHTAMMCINTVIANKQIISINKIVSFIKSQNYFGDVYSNERSEQIKASTYWINIYYPNKGDYSKMVTLLDKVKKSMLEHANSTIEKMSKFV